MSGLPRPGQPSSRRPPISRPSSMRPPPPPSRGRSATPAHSGRVSPTESVASSRVRASPQTGVKRKEREFDQGEETNITVVVRCRGRNERELRENSGVVVQTKGIKGQTVELSMGPNALSNKMYQFDKVFSPAADQGIVFDEVVSPILDEVFNGFNCTIFAYGQTGTGKTYTMSGDISDVLPLPDDAGIVPRVLYSLFKRLETEEVENSVKCSFIELYNEELRDLISADDNVKLKIFEDNNSNKKTGTATMVQGMEERHLKTATEGIKVLQKGSDKRQVAATKCNDLSSRSHTVFTITVHMKRLSEDGQEYLCTGKLNLVDLAGSENIQRSGAENKRAAEAGLINKSLLTLGRVINALVDRSSHIPYRESKLTRLLQDSLGGRTKTCIIATLSPAKSNLEETISTLDYAFRAKNIRNKPQVNQLVSKKTLLKEYTSEIEKLRSELIATRHRNGVYLTQETYEEITTVSESRRILSEEQKDKIETMESNLRNKVQELFSLTSNFTNLKKDHEQIRLTLEGTKGILEKTEVVLQHTKQNLTEETALRKAHEKTEEELATIGGVMISTLGKTTSDIDGLRSKIRRKSDLQSRNRQNWASTQNVVTDATRVVEDRLDSFQVQQQDLVNGLSSRMQTFVQDELDKLGASQTFLQERLKDFEKSEEEVKGQTVKARDDLNEVLEEIKMLREDVKQKVGAGLNELSAAAENISANILAELETFSTQLHVSYASLGREFKNTFEDVIKAMSEQQAENERLHEQIVEANTALVASNRAAKGRLMEVVDEEREKAAAERQQLLTTLTSLITANAEAQEKRLREQVASVGDDIDTATAAHNTQQSIYNEGMGAWTAKSKDIVSGVCKSRDGVKSKIKADFAAATQQSSSIKETTASVHASTVRTVEAQMAHMDTQLHSLDDIVSRIRAQNEVQHVAHTSSLSDLTSTVRSSYTSVGDHLATSFARVESLESDVSAQVSSLRDTLSELGAGAAIREPLCSLRDEVASNKLLEYEPTGETPQRTNYTIPSDLPRTENHDTFLARLRNRALSNDPTRSPTKAMVFHDAINITEPLTLPALTVKPNISWSQNALPSLMAGMTQPVPSLRELDVNIVAQDTSHVPTSPLDAIDAAAGAPPLKRQKAESDSKLPMKRMARKTVAGLAIGKEDRENLSITSFSSSVGPGLKGGRRLRSQGSE
ncbi:kinesin family protein-like protein [Sporormia fimetaria CBS 119925]|uniref:Kinesin family protein-like protein n=1 Tax=Sporormia fimetaria CBS 119925 TaxID=1340428 RepID=A0A6A6VCR8_9PLEO|nr:kinesin family protein-like protein [Sporormia fimetaria CBS 119925]